MLTITFANDTIDAFQRATTALSQIVVDIVHDNDGYPHESVMILTSDDEGIIVCELDDDSRPLTNSTWHVPYEGLRSVSVL